MELSVWSSYYVDLSPEDAVLEFEKHGIYYSELSDEHAAVLLSRGDPKEVGRRFREYADAHGVKFTQGHLWLRCRLCGPEREKTISTLKDWLDLFYFAGVKNAVLHCDGYSFAEDTPDEEKYRANIEAIKELTGYIKGKDLTICLENLRLFVFTADELLYVVEEVGGENIGICLDTGHLNLVGGDQVEFIRKAGKYLKALHIADNDGTSDQHMMPYGRGNIDFLVVMRALKEIGYGGLFNLEIPGERNCPVEIRGYKLEYIKKMYDYLYNNA